ncbi:MAG: DUF2723 domain-containing protein [Prevotellaceae bacterium]|jgi:hypothetical protein|nr:DUF2723 domain-containing protein [Prevotellaceae bacterium]
MYGLSYRKINNIVGWLVFAVAAFTYISTVEPTASLWDCSEFIVSAYKLEVGHPPGAPLFAMLGHLFTMWVSPQNAAIMVNIFSALCSAFTILFLFWSITVLVRKIVGNSGNLSFAETFMIMSCGVVGSLAYTFSDTFWFSAVEGEVYAASSLITAAVFWAILKWDEDDSEYSNRWLILIAYITGLSIGVHLLNLLVVPTIVFVYYFKKYKITRAGVFKTSIVAVLLLASLVWGIIPGLPVIASKVELVFVNFFGFPINSGLLFFVAILIAGLVRYVYYTYKKRKPLANTVSLALLFCVIGYGSYAMIVIRSSADTPMNQNKPDNIFSLIYYLNRNQYGSAPLITGAYYNTASDYETAVKQEYTRLGDKYVKDNVPYQKYNKTYFFPRMWSNDLRPGQVDIYKRYVRGKTPTFFDNVRFFLDYQTGFMYWRYFMWNFVGRQNDMQASIDDPSKGNWISGIKFVDEARLGSTDNLPSYMAQNKACNKYYFLPLILGILGILYQLKRDKKGFTVITMLFFFTGIAIIIYLNQAPIEPRERDYAYAGSFYAFAIWIGMGVAFIYNLLTRKLNKKTAACIALIPGLFVAALMAQQNWDDHDRSGRYVTTDFGYNYLISCDKNAIIYTNGDNDTFSVWYNQEVEGVGTDVRVVNTQYINSDWYYSQMMRRSYDSQLLKTTATPDKILGERRSQIITPNYFDKDKKQPTIIPLKAALGYVFDDSKSQKKYGDITVSLIPSQSLRLPIDKNEVIKYGLASDTSAILPYLSFNISPLITKSKLAALDFAANNFPERPIYYALGTADDYFMGLRNNLRFEGLVYRLVPENTAGKSINVDKIFDLLVNKFRYRGLNNPNIYHDECSKRTIPRSYRSAYIYAANELNARKDTVRLRQLMEKYKESMLEMEISNPDEDPYLQMVNPFVNFYFTSGLNDYGTSLAQKLVDDYRKEFLYCVALSAKKFHVENQLTMTYFGVKNLVEILGIHKQTDLHKQAQELLGEIDRTFNSAIS